MNRHRQDPKQTTFAFKPTGRGGVRPGAGRPRKYRSRMPHRPRERIPGHCPVLVTLRVRDDARFARCVNRVFGRRGAGTTGIRIPTRWRRPALLFEVERGSR